MDDTPQMSSWGSLALVSYIPDPLGAFLNQLRQSLTQQDCPDAHVTMLPPRPLTVPIELASQHLLKQLDRFESFPVELSSVSRFRETNVFYVDLKEGNDRVHELHDALSGGDLAHMEEFEFLPHLTLGCPADSTESSITHLESLRQYTTESWEEAPVDRRFLLKEIVCLWLPPNGSQSEWQRVWSYSLKTGQITREPLAALAASRTY